MLLLILFIIVSLQQKMNNQIITQDSRSQQMQNGSDRIQNFIENNITQIGEICTKIEQNDQEKMVGLDDEEDNQYFLLSHQNKKWTDEDERTLFEYNKIYGNKWAKIASMMGIKSDNCIKNHFYSTLRRGIKYVNNFISQPQNRKRHKPIKLCVLFKMFNVLEDKNDNKVTVSSQIFEICETIKSRLVNISNNWLKEEQIKQEITSAIIELNLLNQSHRKKKKSKPLHRRSVNSYNKPKGTTNLNKDSKPNRKLQSKLCNHLNKQPKVKQQNINTLFNSSISPSLNPIILQQQVQGQKQDVIKLQNLQKSHPEMQIHKTNDISLNKNNLQQCFDTQNQNNFQYASTKPNFDMRFDSNYYLERCKLIYDQLMMQSYNNLLLCNELSHIIQYNFQSAPFRQTPHQKRVIPESIPKSANQEIK